MPSQCGNDCKTDLLRYQGDNDEWLKNIQALLRKYDHEKQEVGALKVQVCFKSLLQYYEREPFKNSYARFKLAL